MVHEIWDFQEWGKLHSPDINSVVTIAHVVKQQLTAMWWNDSEFDSIDWIVSKARKWTLWYVEAVLNIEFIRDNKHWNGWHDLQW